MKKVLSLLLAFVFLQTQGWALSGGPIYGGAQTSLVGTYAGVMTGPTNSLAVFTLGIPDVGIASGDFQSFVEGSFYSGTITGIGDPLENTLRAVLESSRVSSFSNFTDNFFGVESSSATIDGTADGLLDATVSTVAGASFGIGLAADRIIGTAHLDVREFIPATSTTTTTGTTETTTISGGTFELVGSLDYTVDGFKQSATAPQATLGGN